MENFYLKPLATSLHGLRRLTAAVLLLLFAVTAEPAAAGEQDSGRQQPTIQAKGRVVDTNGIAIAGAAVTVKGGSAGGTISDAQGAFTLRVRRSGGEVLFRLGDRVRVRAEQADVISRKITFSLI